LLCTSVLNILLRLKTVVGPVATRTPERYRVKVAFSISIRFHRRNVSAPRD
jgi:hypothetical protein